MAWGAGTTKVVGWLSSPFSPLHVPSSPPPSPNLLGLDTRSLLFFNSLGTAELCTLGVQLVSSLQSSVECAGAARTRVGGKGFVAASIRRFSGVPAAAPPFSVCFP